MYMDAKSCSLRADQSCRRYAWPVPSIGATKFVCPSYGNPQIANNGSERIGVGRDDRPGLATMDATTLEEERNPLLTAE